MRWWPLALLLLAAAASIFNVLLLFVENMMSPGWSSHEPLVSGTLGAIVVMTLVGLLLPPAFGIGRARPWLLALTVLVVGAGFVPRMVVADAKTKAAAEQAVRAREDQAKLMAAIAARKECSSCLPLFSASTTSAQGPPSCRCRCSRRRSAISWRCRASACR